MWLGRLQAAEARVLCFRVDGLCRQCHSEAGAVAGVCRKHDDALLRKLIRETLLELQAVPPVVVPAGAAASPSSSSELEGSSLEEQKGKYISRDLLPPLVKYVPIHPYIQELIKREWRDPDKIILPRFMAKLYPLQDMAKVLPDLVPIDSFVASLVGRISLADDAVIQDAVDMKVDVSLKKAYSGTHLALRAGIYGTYVAQSLNSALDGSSVCSELMSVIERQVEFLSDISFDVV
ncbi:hypothetical protein NDU88_001696 [Pleurodeles waltl]|uniref:Uncharacterized protein n=1 Tax=Pleurodeles waltl TaxID=8319 RepID=A0AAV7T0L9_PLEWA|nr:hypothetical protein NDU88_001696 [Pleurodeles waltl]